MRIAIVGKGGVGKTTIAGALARQLARRGNQVLAMDCDPNPNLGLALGCSRDELDGLPSVLNALIASGHTHNDPKPPADELVRLYGVDTRDGVRLVATGKIERPTDACLCCGSHTSTRGLFAEVSDEGKIVLADLEAGLNDLLWAKPGERDGVIVVAEPTAKATDIARRALALAEDLGVRRTLLVANRSTATEAAQIGAGLGKPVTAIPEDDAIAQADRLGVAALDHAPSCPAMLAVGLVADRLTGWWTELPDQSSVGSS